MKAERDGDGWVLNGRKIWISRADRADLIAALAPLSHQPTWLGVAAERAVSRAMGGSCSMPLAAHGIWHGDELHLQAAWGDLDGQLALVQVDDHAVVTTHAQAEALGEAVAAQLRAAGARTALPGSGD